MTIRELIDLLEKEAEDHGTSDLQVMFESKSDTRTQFGDELRPLDHAAPRDAVDEHGSVVVVLRTGDPV